MKNDTSILPFRQSETIADPLTELAREGARRMLAEALKAEADAFVASNYTSIDPAFGAHNRLSNVSAVARRPNIVRAAPIGLSVA